MLDRSRVATLGKELTKEITVIAVAAGVVTIGINGANSLRSKLAPTPEAIQGPLVSVGSEIKLAGADLHAYPLTLVLVSSPTCAFCLKSKTFHSKVLGEAKQNHIPFYVVIPDRVKAAGYLKALGVPGSDVREFKDLDHRVSGTPTMIAINSIGIARRLWVGAVTSDNEAAILNIIRAPSILLSATGDRAIQGPGEVRNYSLAELENKATAKRVIIDVRERDDQVARDGVIVMPLLELTTRAQFELDRAELQVVDCSNLPQFVCDVATTRLLDLGFRVATLGAGSYSASCQLGTLTASNPTHP